MTHTTVSRNKPLSQHSQSHRTVKLVDFTKSKNSSPIKEVELDRTAMEEPERVSVEDAISRLEKIALDDGSDISITLGKRPSDEVKMFKEAQENLQK